MVWLSLVVVVVVVVVVVGVVVVQVDDMSSNGDMLSHLALQFILHCYNNI
jgi:hypothetical protein